MIAEIAIGALFAFSGFGAVAPVRQDVPAVARVWLSIPIGIAMYLPTALVLIIITGTLSPVLALGITGGLGIIGFFVAGLIGRLSLRDIGWAALAIGIACSTVVLARALHLTRLTPDSLRYLLAATDLVLPYAFGEILRADLLIRQIGLPSLHALSDLVGRRYVASIGPLFGVSGLGFFAWLAWHVTRGLADKQRRWLAAGAVLFIGTSNRLVYDAFYINTHIQMAAYLLIAVAGSWLAVSKEKPGWAWPAGLALAATLLLRPEAPLVVAIILVTVAASRATPIVRVLITIPSVAVMAIWYGIALWQNAKGGDLISLTAPVFGSMVAIVGAALVMMAGGLTRTSRLVRHLDLIALGGLALVVAGYGLRNPDVVINSVESTFRNLTYDGLWLLTWVSALALLAIALVVQRVPDGRLWTVPILGFGLLFWLLPLIRDGAWRVGAGDSGNRILAHILPVVVGFLVLAAVEPENGAKAEGDIP